MRLAGTTRSFTFAITPSVPSDTCAALNTSGSRSGEHSRISPDAVTSVKPSTCVDKVPNCVPVPCVPVLIAPDILCTSMSPRFSWASPCSKSMFPRFLSTVPPSTVTLPCSASMDSMPCISSSDSSTSSDCIIGVNEWPEPATRMWRPACPYSPTIFVSSSILRGFTISTGEHFIEPDQLLHCPAWLVSTRGPPSCLLLLNKTPPVPAVGRNLVYNRAIRDEQQVREPLAQLARFAMAHKHRVAYLEWRGSLVPDRRLHLARSFKRYEFRSLGQVRLRLLLGAY